MMIIFYTILTLVYCNGVVFACLGWLHGTDTPLGIVMHYGGFAVMVLVLIAPTFKLIRDLDNIARDLKSLAARLSKGN